MKKLHPDVRGTAASGQNWRAHVHQCNRTLMEEYHQANPIEPLDGYQEIGDEIERYIDLCMHLTLATGKKHFPVFRTSDKETTDRLSNIVGQYCAVYTITHNFNLKLFGTVFMMEPKEEGINNDALLSIYKTMRFKV